MRTEKYDSAIRVLLEAKKLNPHLPGIDLNLGLAHYYKQENSQAIVAFSHVLEAQPDNYQARYLLG